MVWWKPGGTSSQVLSRSLEILTGAERGFEEEKERGVPRVDFSAGNELRGTDEAGDSISLLTSGSLSKTIHLS